MASITDVCVPNIGPRERRRRLIGGLVMGSIAVIAATVLVIMGTSRIWRALLVLPIGGAALGLFQVHAKTCVALAARGLKNMDHGDEAITDEQQLARIRAQSQRVYLNSLVAALVVTGIVMML
jgi:hypothetical protein